MVWRRRRREAGPVILEEGPTAQGRVVWRTWRLLPGDGRGGDGRPLLTGLSGFPWRGPTVDARCLMRDPAPRAWSPFQATVDRHHRVVPDPACTCGIYASRADLVGPPAYAIRSRDPLVMGFVELSGRLLADGDDYRAQRARVVGPLTVATPRLWGSRRPWVTVVDGRYRAQRTAGRTGVPYGEWLRRLRHELAERYTVPVLRAPA